MRTIKLKADELVLGDAVNLLEGPYGWGTVVQITDEEVHIFRPYVHIGDFSYTGGVLHYTGHELVKRYKHSGCEFVVDQFTHAQMAKTGALH